ncbi:hypothetical protein L596_021338 [Steinernema carpocapsae]|uniref:Uncharacterized protein n=1 Tax=Steinernema carpocapsae TaxID=34508 RepID=A0A4U5MIF6_STECR|nr:hypothetical protein L596_021338 [Steinernema carpocapsae]
MLEVLKKHFNPKNCAFVASEISKNEKTNLEARNSTFEEVLEFQFEEVSFKGQVDNSYLENCNCIYVQQFFKNRWTEKQLKNLIFVCDTFEKESELLALNHF